MTANDTAHEVDSEKRQRMERIIRRLNPAMTDEQLEELMVEFWQGPCFTDG